MSETSRKAALDFMENEKQFHLGFLPTEQSNPMTKHLDSEFAAATSRGVRNLQSVDRKVLEMAQKVFASKEFAKLVSDAVATIDNGGKIVFSGCGATGRLSILLECMWRTACTGNAALAKYADCVFSIMTGGDYALVRSVEFFEDYQSFGRRQAADLDINDKDMIVAITEGGETSSVLGTLFEALDRGAKAFLMFNNPADLLAEHLERSRKAIRDERVCVLDLFCGPMALAGSTRMQATTSEQLVAGAAIECVLHKLAGREQLDYAKEFEKILDQLESAESVEAIAGYIDFEAQVYRDKGYITYFADDYLLDIFTDTTERSPTFMLPPFRKCDDKVSPRPWAFVKNPTTTTQGVWDKGMCRKLRCLEWTLADYEVMGAPASVKTNPPAIKASELLKFEVGNENVEDRIASGKDAAVLVTLGSADNAQVAEKFADLSGKFAKSCKIAVGGNCGDYNVSCTFPDGLLHLMEHMAVKLVLNTVSTGVMAVLGRITGNWMSYVDVSNKKLIDRATRLIAEIGEMSYEDACFKLFEAVENMQKNADASKERQSAVQYVLNEIKGK